MDRLVVERPVSEGTDPTAADKATVDQQISQKTIKVYVYNSQNATPDVQDQVNAATATGIPVTVLAAYRRAEAVLAAAKPSCHLSWWLLAGVGRIETGHVYGGRVDEKGNTRGRITGPVLDGSMPGTAVIRDSDGGKWDGDAKWDRAMGPMQFIPGTWRIFGVDGDGASDPEHPLVSCGG